MIHRYRVVSKQVSVVKVITVCQNLPKWQKSCQNDIPPLGQTAILAGSTAKMAAASPEGSMPKWQETAKMAGTAKMAVGSPPGWVSKPETVSY